MKLKLYAFLILLAFIVISVAIVLLISLKPSVLLPIFLGVIVFGFLWYSIYDVLKRTYPEGPKDERMPLAWRANYDWGDATAGEWIKRFKEKKEKKL